MKKIIILISIMFLLFGALCSTDFIVGFKTVYFSPSGTDFKNIYTAELAFGGEVGLALSKNCELTLDVLSYSSTGELSFTREETKLSLFNLGINGKYLFGKDGKFRFYLSPGLFLCNFKESNVLGEVSKGGLGLKLKGGGLIELSKSFHLEIFAGYSFCKVKPIDASIDVSGLLGGVSIRYTFKKK